MQTFLEEAKKIRNTINPEKAIDLAENHNYSNTTRETRSKAFTAIVKVLSKKCFALMEEEGSSGRME